MHLYWRCGVSKVLFSIVCFLGVCLVGNKLTSLRAGEDPPTTYPEYVCQQLTSAACPVHPGPPASVNTTNGQCVRPFICHDPNNSMTRWQCSYVGDVSSPPPGCYVDSTYASKCHCLADKKKQVLGGYICQYEDDGPEDSCGMDAECFAI